jgi:hypothetical protein
VFGLVSCCMDDRARPSPLLPPIVVVAFVLGRFEVFIASYPLTSISYPSSVINDCKRKKPCCWLEPSVQPIMTLGTAAAALPRLTTTTIAAVAFLPSALLSSC